MKYQVRDVNENDFGKYICMADNGIGPPDQAELQLIEICLFCSFVSLFTFF